jgi:chromosome partitioning protein
MRSLLGRDNEGLSDFRQIELPDQPSIWKTTKGGSMRIISIANQKGGCGKTTTAINLSACLANKGRKTLLIDMDPQGHSALGLNIQPDELHKTVYDALCASDNGTTRLDEVILEIGNNFHIAPSNISLSMFDQHLSMVQGRETRLKEAIDNLVQSYDYIIIDCPPSLGLLTFNSLFASTEVIVPIEMSLFSLHGISKLMEIMDMVRERTGHEIKFKVIATMVDGRTRISKEVLKDIRNNFRNSVFKTTINLNVKLKEAASFGKSILDYHKKARGFIDYMALAQEVIKDEKRLGMTLVKQKKSSSTIEKRFIFHAPDAVSVKIVGSFNNWDLSDESAMERDEEGKWSKRISLKPGTYQYKFLVNDMWIEDRSNPNFTVNSFGGKNSVIEIH